MASSSVLRRTVPCLALPAAVALLLGLAYAEMPSPGKETRPAARLGQTSLDPFDRAGGGVGEDGEDKPAPRDEKPAAPLFARRVQLNLAGAEIILAAAKGKAQAMKLRVNIAIVDDGGHPLAFARMDDARPGSAYTALTKAVTAATMRTATGPFPPGAKNPDLLLNLSLQNAAAASGGKLTTLHGGVPVVVEKQVIGAVGCGGATGEQDAEIARAGIQALLEAVKKGE